MLLRVERDPLNPINSINILPLPTKPPTPVDVPNVASDAPSSVIDQISNTITCSGSTVLYVVRMYDAWGDGWDNTKMEIIKLSNGTLFEENDKQIIQNKTNTSSTSNGLRDRVLRVSSVISSPQKVNEIPLVHTLSGQSISAVQVDSYDVASIILSNKTSNVSSTSDIIKLSNDQKFAEPIFTESLVDGTDGAFPICLSVDQCYEVSVNGGLWPAEVKWDILKANDNNESSLSYNSEMDEIPIARGGAPSKCQFSIANKENGTFVCPFRCQDDVIFINNSDYRATRLPSEQKMNESSGVPLPIGESHTLAPSTLEGTTNNSTLTPTDIQIIITVPTNFTSNPKSLSNCKNSSSSTSSSSSIITLFKFRNRQKNDVECDIVESSDVPTTSPLAVLNSTSETNNTTSNFSAASTDEQSDEPTIYSSSYSPSPSYSYYSYSPSPSLAVNFGANGNGTKSNFSSASLDFVASSITENSDTPPTPASAPASTPASAPASAPATPSTSVAPTQLVTSSSTPSSSYTIGPSVTWWPTSTSTYSPSPSFVSLNTTNSTTVSTTAATATSTNKTLTYASVQVRPFNLWNLRGNGRE